MSYALSIELALALPQWSVVPLALQHASVVPLALQGPDSPNGDILGWLIVFFMVVWPLLRGVVEAANERRRGHVEKQQGGAPRPQGGAPRRAAGPAPVGRAQPTAPEQDPFETLKRALQGQLERGTRAEPPTERPKVQPPPSRPVTAQGSAPRAATAQGSPPRAPTKSPTTAQTRMPTTASPTASPTSRVPVEKHSAPFERNLAGDPFDERMLERALVEDPELAHVPSEGGRPSDAPLRRALPRSKPPADAPAPMELPGAALARLSRRVRTPWGQAVVYEELLGPPVALREPRF